MARRSSGRCHLHIWYIAGDDVIYTSWDCGTRIGKLDYACYRSKGVPVLWWALRLSAQIKLIVGAPQLGDYPRYIDLICQVQYSSTVRWIPRRLTRLHKLVLGDYSQASFIVYPDIRWGWLCPWQTATTPPGITITALTLGSSNELRILVSPFPLPKVRYPLDGFPF